jgi:hypothetical protein
MGNISLLSDGELLGRLPSLVGAEREATADVIEHLVEVERRRLYLEQACASLCTYCRDRLQYAEDRAFKRARVAQVALRFPRALDELRSGALHLTALLLLSSHLTEENADALFAEACGKSRRDLEAMLARRFPRPQVPPRVQALGATAAGGNASARADMASGPDTPELRSGAEQRASPFQLEPPEENYRLSFTASAGFFSKLERAQELASHSVPSGDVVQILERALDTFIEDELKRRFGAGKPHKQRALKAGSRHVPRDIARQVYERDGFQCAFVDAGGRRCQERRFLTLEHRQPFARGGPATVENLCVLCSAHNAYTARQAFGEEFIAEKRAARAAPPSRESPPVPDVFAKVTFALCGMGFPKRAVQPVMARLRRQPVPPQVEPLLRAALGLLTPAPA